MCHPIFSTRNLALSGQDSYLRSLKTNTVYVFLKPPWTADFFVVSSALCVAAMLRAGDVHLLFRDQRPVCVVRVTCGAARMGTVTSIGERPGLIEWR